MKVFNKKSGITGLWDWLHTDKNYEELKQALEEFSKCAEVTKNKVDYLKKIDKFRAAISKLNDAGKENSEKHKNDILNAADALVDYIGNHEISTELEKNYNTPMLNNAYTSIQRINMIK